MVELAILAVIVASMDFMSVRFADPTQIPKFGAVAVLVALGWLSALWRRGSFVAEKDVRIAIGLMLLSATISMYVGKDLYWSLKGPFLAPGHSYITLLLMAATFGLALQNQRKDLVPSWMLWSAMPMCLYAIMQRFGYDPLTHFKLYSGNRAFSFQGGPVYLGAATGLVMPIAISRLSEEVRGRTILPLLAIAVTLWAAKSRGGLIAGVFGAVAMMVSQRNLKLKQMALGCFACLICASYYKPLSDTMRWEVWKQAVRVFREHPLFGVGLMNFNFGFRSYVPGTLHSIIQTQIMTAFEAHNDILEVAATLGLCGLLAYANLARTILRKANIPATMEATGFEDVGRHELVGVLAAAWSSAWFNPAPVSVLILGAVTAGTLVHPRFVLSRNAWMPAMASALAILGGYLCYADRIEERAMQSVAKGDLYPAAVDFSLAAQLNPFDVQYAFFQLKGLHSLIPYTTKPHAIEAMHAGLQIAQQQVWLHPHDADAWQLLGIEWGSLAETDGQNHYGEALAALHKSAKLAPDFWPTIRALGTAGELRRRYMRRFNGRN